MDQIAALISGKSGSGHKFFSRKQFQNSTCKNYLCLRIIKSFADDLIFFKQFFYIFFIHPDTVRPNIQIGINLSQQRTQCLGFIYTHMLKKILLPV